MSRATLEQLNAFVSVAEEGSFSKAARKLRKDRSTLHHQVSDLEIDWNVTLFDRAGRKPVLTENGKALLAPSRFIIYQMQSLERATDDLSEGDKLDITICYDSSIPGCTIARFDQKLASSHPMSRFNWLLRGTEDALNLLETGDADFAITQNRGQIHPDSGMSFINLGYPGFQFYVADDSELLLDQPVSMAQLQRHRQFALEDFSKSAIGEQTAVSSKLSMVSDVDLLMLLLQREGFALLPIHLVDAQKRNLIPLAVDFAAQKGHFGYVLQYPSTAVLKPWQRDVIQTIVTWYQEVCKE
ncbi:transcriptional regulators [Vibrio ishigakensis]|uniref:Transcriptional regulators n=1 Tax=Vibrio ishigakensis TaxID=1481914 RepID=A0A0B8P752_9VIBR|nr:transcriptional regulators [Vibrio ishigakensis]GAM66604.1 transcriptional regulators [Vibrio sp. JCM 19236]